MKFTTEFVRAVSEGIEDATKKRERQERRKMDRRNRPQDSQPTTNAQGEVTSKMVDAVV